MRIPIPTATLFAVLTLAAVPAAAADRPDFQAWLEQAIQRNMAFPAALERSHANGIATVRFSVDGDGRPAHVRIVGSSGNRTIDRAALRTVATLRLPADAPAGPHEAVLQYGTEVSLADRSDNPARLNAAAGRSRLALRNLPRERHAGAGGADAPARTVD